MCNILTEKTLQHNYLLRSKIIFTVFYLKNIDNCINQILINIDVIILDLNIYKKDAIYHFPQSPPH